MSDLTAHSDAEARITAGGARVVETALAHRGDADPRALFREAAVAILRASPPILGPANATIPYDRFVYSLAEGLGLTGAEAEEIWRALPVHDVLPASVRAGDYALSWDGDGQDKRHWLRLWEQDGGLAGQVGVDLGPGREARAARADEGVHVLPVALSAADVEAGVRFRVSLGVPTPVTYDFALAWSSVASDGDPALDLIGDVTIDGERRSAGARWRPSTPGARGGA